MTPDPTGAKEMTENLTERLAKALIRFYDDDILPDSLNYAIEEEVLPIVKQEASEQLAAVVDEIRCTIESGINGRGVYVGDSVSGGIRHVGNFHDLLYWLDAQIISERDTEQLLAQRDERITNELVVVCSCPHMLRYPECSICSPVSVRQSTLEEAAKLVCYMCREGRTEFNYICGEAMNGVHEVICSDCECSRTWKVHCEAQAIRKLMEKEGG